MEESALACYFDVKLGVDNLGLDGQFCTVSGLSTELEFETYCEGGNDLPNYFYKATVPQTLVLERGTVGNIDQFAVWVAMARLGMMIRMGGTITTNDRQGNPIKSWTITDAYPMKYIGPDLDGDKTEYAVTRIELAYNGCT